MFLAGCSGRSDRWVGRFYMLARKTHVIWLETLRERGSSLVQVLTHALRNQRRWAYLQPYCKGRTIRRRLHSGKGETHLQFNHCTTLHTAMTIRLARANDSECTCKRTFGHRFHRRLLFLLSFSFLPFLTGSGASSAWAFFWIDSSVKHEIRNGQSLQEKLTHCQELDNQGRASVWLCFRIAIEIKPHQLSLELQSPPLSLPLFRPPTTGDRPTYRIRQRTQQPSLLQEVRSHRWIGNLSRDAEEEACETHVLLTQLPIA